MTLVEWFEFYRDNSEGWSKEELEYHLNKNEAIDSVTRNLIFEALEQDHSRGRQDHKKLVTRQKQIAVYSHSIGRLPKSIPEALRTIRGKCQALDNVFFEDSVTLTFLASIVMSCYEAAQVIGGNLDDSIERCLEIEQANAVQSSKA